MNAAVKRPGHGIGLGWVASWTWNRARMVWDGWSPATGACEDTVPARCSILMSPYSEECILPCISPVLKCVHYPVKASILVQKPPVDHFTNMFVDLTPNPPIMWGLCPPLCRTHPPCDIFNGTFNVYTARISEDIAKELNSVDKCWNRFFLPIGGLLTHRDHLTRSCRRKKIKQRSGVYHPNKGGPGDIECATSPTHTTTENPKCLN